MMNKAVTHGSPGFTFLEVMVAVLIFSVVITTLFSAFQAFIHAGAAVKESIADTEKISAVFKRMHRDMEGVYVVQLPRYKKPAFDSEPDPFRLTGGEEIVGGQTVSYLLFSSSAHAKIGIDTRNGIAQIFYYTKENDDNTLDLFRGDALPPYPLEPDRCGDPVLCTGISGFELLYTDKDGEQHRNWDSDADEFAYAFPVRVDIKIVFGTKEQETVFETAVSLMSQRGIVE